MLMVAIKTAITARIRTRTLELDICSKAPITMIPEIALVTAMSGVCRDGVTFQMT